jgi:hypothetical protein
MFSACFCGNKQILWKDRNYAYIILLYGGNMLNACFDTGLDVNSLPVVLVGGGPTS